MKGFLVFFEEVVDFSFPGVLWEVFHFYAVNILGRKWQLIGTTLRKRWL